MCRKFSLILSLSMLFVSTVFAQSSGDIELAKQLARQRGYSESQIEDMLNNKRGNQAGVSGKVVSPSVNRNELSYQDVKSVDNKLDDAEESAVPESSVYGHYLFNTKDLNFIPSFNIPTPKNYKLSAGDELVIDLWGAVTKNIVAEISPEGSVYIPDLGPVYVYGQTVEQAEKSIKRQMARIHSGLEGEEPDTYMSLALGKIKSVTVNVIGDVRRPGSYTLPSLSSMASVLYLAGGPDDLGSIREIRLYRNNAIVATMDVYDYLMTGNFKSNIRLEDNDAVMVVPYENMITLAGAVRRPMKYEMKEGETLSDLFRYSGGFSDNAYLKQVAVERKKMDSVSAGPASEVFNVAAESFSSFKLKDGDRVTVNTVNGRFVNKAVINGAVWYPGAYPLSGNLSTVKDLIVQAGGLRDDAFLDKAYIVRWAEDRSKEQVSFSVKDVILGAKDIALAPDDSIYIHDVNSLKAKQIVSINGEVNDAGKFEYRKGITLGDIILMAKGITDAATLEKVEIARRISNANKNMSEKHKDGEADTDTIALVLSYNLLKNPNDADVELEPFDMVFVRRSVYSKPQESIVIEGEVNYPGRYVVEKNTVRLSDIVSKAEGFNKDAYVEGAKLTRVLTEQELERVRIAMAIAKKQSEDSLGLDMMAIEDRYTIAINLVEAVENPGSDADIVLRENDIITVPKYNNTVKVSGGVLSPNAVPYTMNSNFKKYINNSGGYLKGAMRNKVYMIHMNGDVASKGSSKFKVQPGTEIVVPVREKRDSQTMATVMSMATSVTSIAAMVATIVSMTK